MNHQPGRFVDHQDMLILMHNIQWNVLCLPVRIALQFRVELYLFTTCNLVLGAQEFAINRNLAVF